MNMSVNIEVNNRTIKVKSGETILNALMQNGIQVPTLCNMKNFTPTGSCRMCVVEVEGVENLVPACSYPVTEWMKIKTHSPRVIKARKTILELLLANHPDDCLYCERNENCELQSLAEELNVRERRFVGKKNKQRLDQSSAGIVREPAKCILCGRCVRVCEEIQAVSAIEFVSRGRNIGIDPALSKSFNLSSCIECGQCIMVCPTSSFREKVNIDETLDALHDSQFRVYAVYDPVIPVTIGESFGLKSNRYLSGIVNANLRKIGFEKVFEMAFASDMMILESVKELTERLEKNNHLPVISSFCPSLVKYIEQFKPALIPNLSVIKSPQQIMGSLIKNYFAQNSGISPEKICVVSITPCLSRKYESQREEMTTKGIPDVDIVLTTRECIKLIQLYGIDFLNSEEEQADEPFSIYSTSGILYPAPGGMIQALTRTMAHRAGIHETELLQEEIKTQNGYKEYRYKAENKVITFVSVSGMANAVKLLDEIEHGRDDIQYIEILACTGGCMAGGGQPLGLQDITIKNRIKSLYVTDEKSVLKFPDKNPSLNLICEKLIHSSFSETFQHNFSTRFSSKDVLI